MGRFNGLGLNLGNLPLLSDAETRSITAENPTGEKGKGAMATEGLYTRIGNELGQGWKISPAIMIPAGETAVLADVGGPGAVQSMWFAGYISRDFVLRIHWDAQERPCVECPLPDFFAAGWSKNEDAYKSGEFAQLSSIPVAVNPNRGFNCFWEMPFRKRCRITMENRNAKERFCFYQINYTLTEVPDNAAYFHAQFRRTNPLPYKQEYTIADGIEGKGHYVGTSLFVGLNGANRWWGEGEIKFYIDGDGDFPTICGTGTEDYFGGAFDWEVEGRYVTYSTPYMGMYQVIQPDGLYKSQQRFSMYRWHIMDPIRFKKDLRITLQDLGWTSDRKIFPRQDDIASVAYWYQTLPTAPFPGLPDREQLDI